MSKFRRWGLSVLTIASVATVLLLVTGWGSAVAASVSSVIVTNTASNPANVHEAGTANVNVTNTTAMPVNAKNLNTDNNGSLKVAEQGTPNVNITNTTVPTHEQGTANVNVTNTTALPVSVGNFPAAPTSVTIKHNENVLGPTDRINILDENVSAYREVSIYMNAKGPSGLTTTETGVGCFVYVIDSSLFQVYTIGGFDTGTIPAFGNTVSVNKTFDIAAPEFSITCDNESSSDPAIIDWTLVGRTG